MKIKHDKPSIAEADMTPMIDMTFQLIAFFMIASNFEQSSADERVKLPADRLARPAVVPRNNEVTLNIGFNRNSKGDKISQAFVFYGSEEIPILEYGPRLKKEYILTEKIKGKEDAADMTVVIRADGDTPTGAAQELIKMGQEAGFTKFSLKARTGEEEE